MKFCCLQSFDSPIIDPGALDSHRKILSGLISSTAPYSFVCCLPTVHTCVSRFWVLVLLTKLINVRTFGTLKFDHLINDGTGSFLIGHFLKSVLENPSNLHSVETELSYTKCTCCAHGVHAICKGLIVN